MRGTRSLTIFELVQTIQDIARSDEEVVAVLAHMLKTGRVQRSIAVAAAA